MGLPRQPTGRRPRRNHRPPRRGGRVAARRWRDPLNSRRRRCDRGRARQQSDRSSMRLAAVGAKCRYRFGRDRAGRVEFRDLCGESCQPTAPRFARGCAFPRRGRRDHARYGRPAAEPIETAICGTVLPFSAQRHRASRPPCRRVFLRTSDRCRRLRVAQPARLSGSGLPRRIFPVSRPQPSGLHTTVRPVDRAPTAPAPTHTRGPPAVYA